MTLPRILNNDPLVTPVPTSAPYYSYYFSGSSMGTFTHENQLIFKFIGYNPDGVDPYSSGITYSYSGNFETAFDSTPITNTNNGWINGTLKNIGTDINTYSIDVTASTAGGDVTASYTFQVIGTVSNQITWVTDSDLGNINNGAISDLSVKAIFGYGVTDGQYRLASGSELPTGLQLLANGGISGRVEFNASGVFSFTIEAYSPEFSEISSTKEFTLTVVEKFSEPYDTIYMKALLSQPNREMVQRVFDNINNNLAQYIYRPTDPYFGVAKDIRYQHQYGVYSVASGDFLTDYNNMVTENFYWRDITLGPLQTAVAKDSLGNIIYEVVYSRIDDNLNNSSGTSISKQITWPRQIPGVITRTLYPASLTNMRIQTEDVIGMFNDASLLPRWMDSQQSDGNVPGYIPCWVLCYTIPNAGNTVMNSISSYLSSSGISLNQLTFQLDRFEVDRSYTYSYDGTGLPGQSVNNDSKDSYIYFPQKTILPNSSL